MKQSRSFFNTAGCLLALTSLLIQPSCSQDEFDMPVEDGHARIGISIPGEIGTRGTFGDMDKADINTLHWTLYEVSADSDGSESYKEVTSDVVEGAFENGEGISETVSMPLVVGKQYRIAFCAMSDKNQLAEYNNGSLLMHYEKASCNSANDDVFTGVSDLIDMTSGQGYSDNLTLSRPLAQINWGSTDFSEHAVAAHINETSATVTYKSGLFGSLDIVSGIINDPKSNVSFPVVDCSKLPTQDFPAESSVDVKLVAMNYVLTAKGQSTINCGISFSKGFSMQVDVNSAPVQANYRTNIYGALITNSGEVTVEMSRAFSESGNDRRYLSPETQKVVDALNRKDLNIEIPEDATIDLTGLGSFNLADGQTITVNGELVLDTKQLVLNEEAGKTLTVTFQGNGSIYGNGKAKNLVYVNHGTKAIIKDLNYVCIKEDTDGSGSAIINKGELEIHNVNLKSNLYAISVSEGGTLNAVNLRVEQFANKSHAVYLSTGTAYLKDCNVTTEYMTAAFANFSSFLTIEGGNYHVKGKNHAIEFDNSSSGQLTGCTAMSKEGAAVSVRKNGKVTINGGKFIAHNELGALHLDLVGINVKVLDGDFIGKYAIRRASTCRNDTLTLQGGRYSTLYYVEARDDEPEPTRFINLPTAEGFHVEAILNDSEFSYHVTPDNAP